MYFHKKYVCRYVLTTSHTNIIRKREYVRLRIRRLILNADGRRSSISIREIASFVRRKKANTGQIGKKHAK